MASSTVSESIEETRRGTIKMEDYSGDYYWLRFLELEESDGKSKGSVSYKKLDKMGQSIFTVTKRLRREEGEVFGFEDDIIWSKPCVIDRILKHSPADQSHLEKGDFIIFANKINVVDKSKQDILEILQRTDALTLEVFRRSKTKHEFPSPLLTKTKRLVSVSSDNRSDMNSSSPNIDAIKSNQKLPSKSSVESKRKQLVTFSKDESTTTSGSIDSQRSLKFLQALVQSENQFFENLKFGSNRYVCALKNRKDLLSSQEHEILFNNIEHIKEVMEKIMGRDNREEADMIQAYKTNLRKFIEHYENYFAMMNLTDSIVADKTHHPSFIKFIANPPVPCTLHNYLQKPMEFYTNLQRNLKIILGQISRIDSREYEDLSHIINQLQLAYAEAISRAAMRKIENPLYNLETRLVFTKCNPFKLAVEGRQLIFGGDLTRIEGNLDFPTHVLLFNDIILFSTINRDRVLFITEEPINLKSIVESYFNIKKKDSEFRLTIETNPNYKDYSPTTHCTPDLIKSPLKQSKRRNIFLRASSEETKKVWQNFITQQIFNVNSPTINHVETSIVSPSIASFTRTNSRLSDRYFTNGSTKTIETEDMFSPYRKINAISNATTHQLNLKSQNAFDLSDSVVEDEEDEVQLATPETPSCANLSSLNLNGKIQKSLSTFTSFSSMQNASSCGESCEYEIFNDFDSADISFSNDVKECMFLQNDPFYADDES